MSAPRVVSEPVGGGALTRAALEGSAPRGWFAPRPRGVEEWRGHAEVVRRGFDGVRWLSGAVRNSKSQPRAAGCTVSMKSLR